MASSEYVSGRPFLAVRLAEYPLSVIPNVIQELGSVYIFAEPKSDTSTIYKRSVILGPVVSTVLLFLFRRNLVLLACHVEPQIFV
jgi:hypothetical protein